MKKVKIIIMSVTILALISTVLLVSNSLIFKKQVSKDDISQLSYIDVNSKEFNDSIMEAFKKEYGENYKEILAKNEESSSIASKIALEYMNQDSGEINYPTDFGGQYINEDNDLVIQIVKNSNSNKSIKQTALNISENVVYEYVNNSYEELKNVNDKIIAYFSNENAINNGLNANYIDVIKNVVIVELKNNSIEEQNWFKNSVIDSNLIRFIKSDKPTSLTTTYNAGGNINNYCSIGYRAKRNNVSGFITAAHCYSLNYNINGFGEVIDRKADYANGIDGEFVQLSSGNSVTNNIQWSTYTTKSISTNTNMYKVLVVGGAIAKSGITTQATSGKITNLEYSSLGTDGTYNAKFVLTTANCDNGDSGGVVYQPGNQATGGIVAGIVHAKECTTPACDQPGPMIFSRADFLDSKLSLSRY